MGKGVPPPPAAAAVPQNHRGTSAEGVALGDPLQLSISLEEKKPNPSHTQHPLHKCKHFLRVKVIDFPGLPRLYINQYLKMPGKDRETQLLQVL